MKLFVVLSVLLCATAVLCAPVADPAPSGVAGVGLLYGGYGGLGYGGFGYGGLGYGGLGYGGIGYGGYGIRPWGPWGIGYGGYY